jgi:hypothetical protein
MHIRSEIFAGRPAAWTSTQETFSGKSGNQGTFPRSETWVLAQKKLKEKCGKTLNKYI